ncbi:hypothetical protein, partial [Clostridium sp. MSTE9]|uniref:hypothetical protein n=1 Tax=Clostridium sp. (strain MSTE9) TaxID=1105031 RepID=UPI001A981667
REFQGGENRNSPLWRIFAYFLFAKKGSARPGTRGMPAQAETHAGKPVENLLFYTKNKKRFYPGIRATPPPIETFAEVLCKNCFSHLL